MFQSRQVDRFVVALAASAALVCSHESASLANPAEGLPAPRAESPTVEPLYHPDRNHLWNRLHEAFLVRSGPDGRTYGHDRLEPLLWRETQYLLAGPAHDKAVALLTEFLESRGEELIDDPLKRAVLQRDLWLVFDWLEESHSGFVPQGTIDEEQPAVRRRIRGARQRLRRPLAAVIRRLALEPDQIRNVPDHYMAAAASGEFARNYDPAHPDRPYLAPDLFAADGPWVCIGRPDGPVAPQHVRDENPFTNATFFVFLRLPEGRAATVAYVHQLRAFDEPLLTRADKAGGPPDEFLPNPDLPPLPVGTEVALVRRALLISSSRTPMASALTESVQLRVYREVPELTARSVSAALAGGSTASLEARAWQSSHEFHLSRAWLFAGRAGGLRALGPDTRDFKTGFGAKPADEFERSDAADRLPSHAGQAPVIESCFACHGLPGVYSLNSFFSFRVSDFRSGNTRRPAVLSEMPVAEVSRMAVSWKQDQPEWKSLQAFWKSDRR